MLPGVILRPGGDGIQTTARDEVKKVRHNVHQSAQSADGNEIDDHIDGVLRHVPRQSLAPSRR